MDAARGTALLSIFTSTGTLVCCALPAALVALGAGAALTALVGAVPQLVWLSEHKDALFAVAAAMLALAGLMQWRARTAPCPIDAAQRAACLSARRLSRGVYLGSVAVFLVGGFFAYLAPLLLG
ncbi:MAG: hypothetical protein ING50_05935 [Burkholderiales bacterium]|nr:hypothetical protein [Burkholderiales bacterium]MCA3214397.1 hypothetical protein [Burkholderiales bacterium]